MAGALSKRQQARNERVLQDLIKNVQGNNVCADCQARNPGWASWSLGVFLCMRCAALHRKMGTHISKVKSLSMDSWSNEQVDNMRGIGNIASNRIYNPKNVKPPIPFDADEADSAMERYIRQKYQERDVKPPTRHHTGSTNSDDAPPPPLPPKSSGKFGFRSASSIFPLSSKSKREVASARFDLDTSRSKSPPDSPRSPRLNKQSRVFGASVDYGAGQDFEAKLSKLRDMGFSDEKRNLAVLKTLHGNLEKSIETLVRLGDGGSNQSALARPAESVGSSRSRTPASAGLSINRSTVESSPQSSNNPFDMLDKPAPVVQTQSSQSTGGLPPQSLTMGSNPYQQASPANPFGLQPAQSQYNLNQAFQAMTVSQSQPLFPHHTGGFPATQQQQPPQQLYQQSMTPPVPSIPQQYYPSVMYETPTQQPQQPPQNTSYNPFMQQAQQAPPINTNLHNNPFLQQQMTPQSLYQSPLEQSPAQSFPATIYEHAAQSSPQPVNPFFTQNNGHVQQQQQAVSPSLAQHNRYQQPQQAQPQQQQMPINPFLNQANTQTGVPQQLIDYSQQQQQQNLLRQQTYPLLPQPTGRVDKRSILDLYNYPQLAPARPQPLNQQQTIDPQSSASSPLLPQPSQLLQQRSVSSPVTSPLATDTSKNPFAASSVLSPSTNQAAAANGSSILGGAVGNGARHVSQESMSVDTGGWMNGRHSPDAWGSISARSMR